MLINPQHSPRHFSAAASDIFFTLVIATDHLPPGDVETIIAGTRARGGVYRDGLTRDVTHLLVLSPTGMSLLQSHIDVLNFTQVINTALLADTHR